MKKFISTLVAVVAVAVMALNLTSCGNSSMAKLQAEVDNFNKNQAPMDGGAGMVMTGCSLDEGKKMLVFNFTNDESVVPNEVLSEAVDQFKEGIVSSVGNDADGKKLIDMLAEVDYGMQFVIKGTKSGKNVESTISAAEVKKMAGTK